MWLILTEPYDDTGAWLTEGLRAHAPGPVVHLTSHDILHGASTAHGLDEGVAWFHLRLASGLTIDSRTLRGVVNRICALPPGLAFRLRPPHRDSAERNFGLPLLHLLHGFAGPVLNRPTPQGISGDFRLDFEWAALAAQVGFARTPARAMWATRPSLRNPPDVVTVAVIGDHVLPLDADATEIPAGIVSCCRRLATLSRCNLFGLDLTRTDSDSWHFLRANSRASLIPGGWPVLNAVARALAAPVQRPVPAPARTGSRVPVSSPPTRIFA